MRRRGVPCVLPWCVQLKATVRWMLTAESTASQLAQGRLQQDVAWSHALMPNVLGVPLAFLHSVPRWLHYTLQY